MDVICFPFTRFKIIDVFTFIVSLYFISLSVSFISKNIGIAGLVGPTRCQLPLAKLVAQQDNAGTSPWITPYFLFYCHALLTLCRLSYWIGVWGVLWALISNAPLPLTLPLCLQPSSCRREIYHIPNLLIGRYSQPLPERWQGGIDKRHNAKRCVPLFLHLSLSIPLSTQCSLSV